MTRFTIPKIKEEKCGCKIGFSGCRIAEELWREVGRRYEASKIGGTWEDYLSALEEYHRHFPFVRMEIKQEE